MRELGAVLCGAEEGARVRGQSDLVETGLHDLSVLTAELKARSNAAYARKRSRAESSPSGSAARKGKAKKSRYDPEDVIEISD